MNKNYSYTYLLPLLSEQVYLDKEILSKIENTYMFLNKELQIKFYFLCKFNYRDPEQTKLENRFASTNLFIKAYDDGEYSLFEFKFPEEYKNEFIHFKNGEYSLFGKDAKKLILDFWSTMYGDIPSFVTGSLLRIKQILYKDPKLRKSMIEEYKADIPVDAELGNKIDIEEENYILENNKNDIDLESIKNLFK